MSDPRLDDPATQDAMRGVLWSKKYRGYLEDHSSVISREDLLKEAKRWKGWAERRLAPHPQGPVVSGAVGIGTYGWKYNPEIIERALELGVPFIDTGETYGYGKVEAELGKIFKDKPNLPMVATKLCTNHTSRSATVSSAKRSRDRLQIPTIPLYQIHWPLEKRPLEETFEALAQLLEEKVVWKIGVSNFCVGQLARARLIAQSLGFDIVSNQIRLNRTDSSASTYLLPYCARSNVHVIAYSPFSQRRPTDTAASDLSWVLYHPGVAYVIPRTNKLPHLEENLRSV